MVIHKYQIEAVSLDITLPYGSEVVHVAEQNGKATIWIKIDRAVHIQKVVRSFFIVGTGLEFPHDSIYRGSAFVGPFVWHVMEKPQ